MGNWFSGPSVPSKNEHKEGAAMSFVQGATGTSTHDGKGSVVGEASGAGLKGAYDAAGVSARSAGDHSLFGGLSEMARPFGDLSDFANWAAGMFKLSGGSRTKKQRKQKKRKQTRRHRN